MNRALTRRQVLATGVASTVALAGCARPGGPEPDHPAAASLELARPSWLGKTVLPRRQNTVGLVPPPLNPANPGAAARPPIAFNLGSASYTVKAERDGELQVCFERGGLAWVDRDDFVTSEEAESHFSTARIEPPGDPFAILSRGWAHYLNGRHELALIAFAVFLSQSSPDTEIAPAGPRRWEGLVNRGLVLAEMGRFELALKDLNEAVQHDPQISVAWVNRGYTRELMGMYYAATADYARATAAAPLFPLADNNLAWVLATCPDARTREATSAVKLAKKACAATEDREGMFLDTLAAAYAEARQFDDAIRTQELALGDRSFDRVYGDGARKRLQLYRDRKPFRTEPVSN